MFKVGNFISVVVDKSVLGSGLFEGTYTGLVFLIASFIRDLVLSSCWETFYILSCLFFLAVSIAFLTTFPYKSSSTFEWTFYAIGLSDDVVY